jgi:hypothetical protein
VGVGARSSRLFKRARRRRKAVATLAVAFKRVADVLALRSQSRVAGADLRLRAFASSQPCLPLTLRTAELLD